MPDPDLNGGGNAIDELLRRAPDDSLETRTIKRQGFSLQLAIGIISGLTASVVGGVVYIQSGEADDCQEQIEQLREDQESAQSLLLAQINDRLDSQSGDLIRCREQNERTNAELRELEEEWRDKLAEMNARLHEQ